MRDDPIASLDAPLTVPLVAEAEADEPLVPVAGAVVGRAVVAGARVVDVCGSAGVVSVDPLVSDDAVTPLGQSSVPMSDRGMRSCKEERTRAGQPHIEGQRWRRM